MVEQLPAVSPLLAHSVEGSAKRLGVGRTAIYEEIKAGRLKARKIGRRTVILDDDLRQYATALPTRAA